MNRPSSVRTSSVALTVALAHDTAARLSQIAARRGHTLEGLLVELAEKAAHEIDSTSAQASLPVWQRSREERVAAWKRWCDGHRPVDHVVDDSRASIYAGRGE